jgi:DNA-binding CsgD family transcriptional regulator
LERRVVTDLNWEHVGVQLLERERRPVFVLDGQGRVERTNRAFLSLLPDGSRTHQVPFRDWLAASSLARFDQALTAARRDGRTQVTLELVNTLLPLDLVLELVRLGPDTDAVMAVMVDTVSRAPSAPLRPASGLSYELAAHGKGWRLVRVVSADDHPVGPVDPQRPCWEQLFGRTSECPNCPLRREGLARHTTGVLTGDGPAFAATLLVAERHGDRATVTAQPIDAAAWGQLTQARIAHLAASSGLNERERDVLSLLVMGRSLDDIATALELSVRTAKYHQQKILEKVGADSRLDLVRLVL